MPPAPHHVLLLGGHGKISQLLTPLLLRRGWDVTSVIRAPEQVATIEGLAARGDDATEGKLNVLVRSLEEVKSEGDAKAVVDEVGADFVVWSAGECFLFLFFSFLRGDYWEEGIARVLLLMILFFNLGAGGKGGPDRVSYRSE